MNDACFVRQQCLSDRLGGGFAQSHPTRVRTKIREIRSAIVTCRNDATSTIAPFGEAAPDFCKSAVLHLCHWHFDIDAIKRNLTKSRLETRLKNGFVRSAGISAMRQ